MAEGAVSAELASIKIHTGIAGLLFSLAAVLLHVSWISATIISVLADTGLYTIQRFGFIFGGLIGGSWALFSAISYLLLACKGKSKGTKPLYLRLIRLHVRWAWFVILLIIAGLVFLGCSMRLAWYGDTRLYVFSITAIVGSALNLVLTFLGSGGIVKVVEKFGLKLAPPPKPVMVTVLKSIGVVFLVLSVHQFVWAIIGLSMPKFNVSEYPVRIAAFVVGGIVNSLLGCVNATICFWILRTMTSTPTERGHVMITTLIQVHKSWAFVLLLLYVPGVALFGSSIGTMQYDYGYQWDVNAPTYVVAGFLLSIVAAVLTAYMTLMLMHYYKFDMYTNPRPAAVAKKTNTPKKESSSVKAKSTNNKVKNNAASKTATKTTTTVAVNEIPTASSSDANTTSTSGACGTDTDIERIKERNRLLREQINLEKELNNLRMDRTLYDGTNVHIGQPNQSIMPPVYAIQLPSGDTPVAPPSYDELTYPEK